MKHPARASERQLWVWYSRVLTCHPRSSVGCSSRRQRFSFADEICFSAEMWLTGQRGWTPGMHLEVQKNGEIPAIRIPREFQET